MDIIAAAKYGIAMSKAGVKTFEWASDATKPDSPGGADIVQEELDQATGIFNECLEDAGLKLRCNGFTILD